MHPETDTGRSRRPTADPWRPLAAVAVAALLVLAGCSGPGNRTPQTIEGSASKATVGGSALSATGFSEATVEQGTLRDSGTLDVSGDVELEVNYRIEATTWRAVYRRGEGGQDVFAAYSVPLVKPDDVAATIDPLSGRSVREVARRAQGVYGEFGDLTHVSNATVSMLGNETTLAKYRATATMGDESVGVFVYVARVRHAGDVVVAVAVLPRSADDPGAVAELVAGIEH